ncbi:cytochrome c [Haloferula sp. BvORR071]|uniref:cytochrome c n=1 Tax=Haloferula sp. BvORR071 TaxID=1396141 RepID=UPI0006968017|nr:cytochrome c [Haloferula sp. BvORR071]
MHDPTKPDLEESVNVTEAHERVLRGAAAASRENRLTENGAEPVSMWVMALCFIPVMFAGWTAFGYGTPLFSYKDTVREGYVQVIPPDDDGAKAEPMTAVLAYSKKGAKIYSKCSGCHGPDGKGDGNAYPSLAGSAFAQGENERFAMIVLNGLTGPTSYGKTFGVMPAQGAGMSPEDLACVMTYVRNNFGNKVGDVVSKAQAAEAIKISAGRAKAGAAVTGDELNADHKKTLSGAAVKADDMVDPITLEAVAK